MLKEEIRFHEKNKMEDIKITESNKSTNRIFWFMMAIVFVPILTIIIVYLWWVIKPNKTATVTSGFFSSIVLDIGLFFVVVP